MAGGVAGIDDQPGLADQGRIIDIVMIGDDQGGVVIAERRGVQAMERLPARLE